MDYTLNRGRLTLRAIVAMLVLAPLSVAHSQTPSSVASGMGAIAHQLADKLKDFDKKGVLVLDMSTPEYPWLPFGSSLADQFSPALAKSDHELEVVDRFRLKAALDAQHLSPKDEFDMKDAIALAKSLGANTLILGSFGAAENGVGVTVFPIRVSDNGIPQQRTFTTDLVRGKIALTREIAALLEVPLDSLRPKDGIDKAGVGGVGVPFCLKCAPPSPRSPGIDIQGLAREKRNGGNVTLDFVVTAEGRVSQVTVAHPIGFGIEEQYGKTMKDWEYKPALDADDKPVPVRVQVRTELNFDFSGMYSTSQPHPNAGNTIEAITRELADKLKESDKKSVLVVDLSTPEYPWLPFGASPRWIMNWRWLIDSS
jgi:TonB family protein